MVLTFEKIRELYWIERDRKELQELPENFFQELREYLKKKGDDEQVKNVAMDLINRRVKKILEAALIYTQTKIYPINLTEEEKVLFEEILKIIKRFNDLVFEITSSSVEETNFIENIENKGIKQKEENNDQTTDREKKQNNEVIVKEDLPTFVGPDLKVYTLKKGEKVELPKELKEFLAKKNVIVEVI